MSTHLPERAALALMACLFLLFAACLGDKSLEEVDPDAAPARPEYDAHIAPIMAEYCIACHAPDAPPGELGGIGLDECEKVKANMEIVEEMVFDREVMPPGGSLRMISEDQLALERWFDQGADCD